VPESHEVRLVPAGEIGGTVLTESGSPIQGAVIAVLHFQRSIRTILSDDWYLDASVKTDASGRWKLRAVPAQGSLDKVVVKVTHPDYAPFPKSGTYELYSTLTGQPPSALRDGSARFVLSQGRTLSGAVVDASGQPVAGCRVASGQQTWKTDANGRFSFQCNAPVAWLTFEADGHGPEWKEVRLPQNAAAPLEPLAVSLPKPKTLRVHVVRPDGSPCAGLAVNVSQWRTPASRLHWSAKTDAEGRFTWPNAPGDLVRLAFTGSSEFLSGVPLMASDQEIEVMWKPALLIKGTVVDDETGAPIPAFKITEGVKNALDSYWMHDRSTKGTEGAFQWQTMDFKILPGDTVELQVEAEDYDPVSTPAYETRQQMENVALRMKRRK
jgi:protocatechuate 3,4-dioxygenase beta subunit